MTLPILILAAGASSRMRGADKMLADIDGVPLVRRQAEMALTVSDQVFVALPSKPHPRYDALTGLNVTLVEVSDAADGMSASMKAGFSALPDHTKCVMVLLADLPEITGHDLRQVIDAKSQYPNNLIWRGATNTGKAGHPIIFDRTLFSEIAKLSGDTGGQSIIRAHQDKVHLVPLPDTHARMDLDTPEDWARWRENR